MTDGATGPASPPKEPLKQPLKYPRVLLKLSGEALAGPKGFGFDFDVIEEFASEILTLLQAPERRHFLGEIARKVMVQEWDWRVRGPQIAGMMVA